MLFYLFIKTCELLVQIYYKYLINRRSAMILLCMVPKKFTFIYNWLEPIAYKLPLKRMWKIIHIFYDVVLYFWCDFSSVGWVNSYSFFILYTILNWMPLKITTGRKLLVKIQKKKEDIIFWTCCLFVLIWPLDQLEPPNKISCESDWKEHFCCA